MPVYVIQAGDGPCKIGRARNVQQRLSALQTSTHVKLRLVAVYEGGEAEEAALHKQFAAVRLGGEWFDLSQDALDGIALRPFDPDNPAPATPRPPPKPKRERGPQPVPGEIRNLCGPLICALMKANGIQPEDLPALTRGAHPAVTMHSGVYNRGPEGYERLREAFGVTHQYLKYGRNFVRRPMGRPA